MNLLPSKGNISVVLGIKQSIKIYPEHSYAFRKQSVENNDFCQLEEEIIEASQAVVDSRKCLFCGALGDQNDRLAGRILPCRFNEWAHLNCALWSSEVSLLEILEILSRHQILNMLLFLLVSLRLNNFDLC